MPPTERLVATVRSATTESASADHCGTARPYRPASPSPSPLSRSRWALRRPAPNRLQRAPG